MQAKPAASWIKNNDDSPKANPFGTLKPAGSSGTGAGGAAAKPAQPAPGKINTSAFEQKT